MKVIGWGWFYPSTVLDDFSRSIIAWKLCTHDEGRGCHRYADHDVPRELERRVAAFVEHYNHCRYHESPGNLTDAAVYFGRADIITLQRERIKRETIKQRRLLHRNPAA